MVERRATQKRRSAGAAASEPAAATQPRLGLLDQLLGYHLRRAQLAVFQDFAATIGAKEATPGQLGILALIEANPGLSQARLGQAIGADRSTMVGMIDRLEARGLVVREAAPNDRRSHALKLSIAGAALLRRLAAAVEAHERHIARGLTVTERQQLIALLKRLAAPE